ncbi:NADH dehydrogenase [ubiquinone] 1 beta subcomplex subunit 9 [Neolecta irregularis DAH-3]|uniref:NADH dehydrogenase [ubiquinone] 1 beta subcomplex subunit 9 n=1 Tax=Neolecta irregularis (strain DAH-3) TaxID=1198029 RepID=A0A1U7LI06_NEOID|nr:NADH dehydrogenase [ubiquinone] 1 beta subcomplex subunit 9 [Neolecta irregularis DAH-3]|eukprot:OLL22182.1 NADH dehydrogenase [ubiquinone] 1 beta subcomplex subunit 9 [Neolecta irregularis DAH-3]
MSLTAAFRTKVLYRRTLKISLDWTVDHLKWRTMAVEIRELFDSHKSLQDPREIAKLLDETEAFLDKAEHSDPYTIPTGVNGSKWERNKLFDDGKIPPVMEPHSH